MPPRLEPYLHDELGIFVAKACRLLAGRYDAYGVTTADLAQEMWAWAYENDVRIRRWLAATPQQTTRIFRSFYDEGMKYAEKEKAERVGYKSDDVMWYSPNLVTSLLPFALDPDWEGFIDGDVLDDVIVMVIDVRKAIDIAGVGHALMHSNEGDERFESAVQMVVDHLGGNRHYVGRRRPMGNSRAQGITGDAA
jgi:hypothetical protein